MMKSFIFLIFFMTSAIANEASNPVGFYSKGRIDNAVQLEPEGKGYMHLFLDRDRGWGSQEIVDMLTATGQDMDLLFPEKSRLQIGDIGAQMGGAISRHGSHQNGLDVDLAYYRKNGTEQSQDQNNGFAEVMVTNKKLSKNFDLERNWELVKTLHKNGKVQRIFMDPLIKRALCEIAKMKDEVSSQVEVLRSIRPYPNHADHLHVRLFCPSYAPDCVEQEDPAPGSGCNGL